MSFDYTLHDLIEISRVKPEECPQGEEGEWSYCAANAALEARIRLEAGCDRETAKALMAAIPRLEHIAAALERKRRRSW